MHFCTLASEGCCCLVMAGEEADVPCSLCSQGTDNLFRHNLQFSPYCDNAANVMCGQATETNVSSVPLH